MNNIADPVSAAVTILLNDRKLALHTEDRIYGNNLDEEDNPVMPTDAVVVKESGGGSIGDGARGRSLWRVCRLDVRCYGKTSNAADATYWIMHEAMVAIERRVAAECIVHDAVVTGGPLPGQDSDTGWPFPLGVYDLSYVPLRPRY